MKNIIQTYKKLLSEIISFPSVSTNPAFKKDIKKARDWYIDAFKRNNFKVRVLKYKNSNDVILAEYNSGKNLKTALIYGHYDVQPAKIEDGWLSHPFKLTDKKGRLYGRGVVDNKGQNLIHIVSILELIKNKRLKYNVKFLLEGDEETGSENIKKIIKLNKEKLNCDFILISDGEVYKNKPTIETGFRGTFNATILIETGKGDLHSGIYGGVELNPAKILCDVVSKIYSKNNKIAIKGFYKKVKPLPREIKDEFLIKTGYLPCIEITGFYSGYIDEGYKNAIPSKAFAKLNFRLVENQKVEEVTKLFKEFVSELIPKGIKYKILTEGKDNPVSIDVNNEYVKKAENILKKIWKKDIVYRKVGGSLPIVGYFKELLNVPLVMVPLANEDCNMHGPNENFTLGNIKKGIIFSSMFFSKENL